MASIYPLSMLVIKDQNQVKMLLENRKEQVVQILASDQCIAHYFERCFLHIWVLYRDLQLN